MSHSDDIEELVRLGRDVEKSVLARGLRYHLEDGSSSGKQNKVVCLRRYTLDLANNKEERGAAMRSVKVRDYMSTNLITFKPESDLFPGD